ncbi:MAG: FAD-binding oxidoreductase [Anaerolineae bacterium]|nr:FAD-binding oxidoreductase [Anaerolineae bacterium]
MTAKRYRSWGGYPTAEPRDVVPFRWRTRLPDLSTIEAPMLPFGLGRSYGDSCLNDGGVLLDMTAMNQLIAFDREKGLIRCEAGVSLAQVLDLIVPHGWHLPVTPGTKFVTVGGAIANDVHGKNHHVAGTFGCHVTQFELLRSDGERLICSPEENVEMFRSTIGGLGLTGVILWAEFTLRKIPSPLIQSENTKFGNMDEFFALSDSHSETPYTMSWVDCQATGRNLGRGIFMAGDFYDPPLGHDARASKLTVSVPPVQLPFSLVGTTTSYLFNQLYFYKQLGKRKQSIGHYEPFFYPLDAVHHWHRVYGKDGFIQYQFVMPYEDREPIRRVLKQLANSGESSPIVVFKTFGDIQSPGYLSFPRPGVTLAVDVPNHGAKTLRLLDELDQIVFAHGGALYPAKDSRMSGENFRKSFPCWEKFAENIDPKFSSSFWRRVMG